MPRSRIRVSANCSKISMAKDDEPTYFEPLPLEQARAGRAQKPRNVPQSVWGPKHLARRVDRLSRTYPWLKADQALAIARTQWKLDSEMVADMAALRAESKKKRGFNWLS